MSGTEIADPTQLGATQIVEAMRDGKLSSRALMEAVLDRIDRLNPGINAIVSLRPRAELLAEARDRDNRALAGPLHGLANQEVLAQQARLELARVEADVLQLRERLTRLMGLWGAEGAAWSLPAQLPDLPPAEASLAKLESTAVDRRLDLAALRQELDALTYERDTANIARWLPGLSAGVSGERSSDGEWQIGPAVSLSLPLFDRRQGELARIDAQSRATEERFADLAVAIRAEVRATRARLLAAREIAVHLRDTLVPLREKVVRLTQEQYNFMLVSAFQLLDAKQNQLATYRDYAESVRDYWLAHNELRRAIGGPLPTDE